MKMLLTRIGVDSKMVITGDLLQSDIKEQTNGLDDLIKRCEKLFETSDESCINITRLDENDMLRNDVVIEILKLYEMNV
jgi:phosphate starvation-inducible PhoH-like protein